MRISILWILVLCIPAAAYSQALKFNSLGKFKIVQFTDIHYVAGAAPSESSLTMMEATLDAEKPDLVVFTGDIVVKAPTRQGWDEVLEPVIRRNIPYAVVFGNHDDESEMKRREVAAYVVTKKGLINRQTQIQGVDGYLNAAVPVTGRNGGNGAVLYLMDSHAYSTNPKVKGYGWFSQNQVDWYKKTSTQFRPQTGDTLPALAFFHIPLPEYRTAFNDIKNKRLGVRYENECPPELNTGMFTAMLEGGDVLGMFVGHDHVNDYLVEYYDIALAYGCWSGSANTYQRQKNGARIIELTEGVRGFDTYLREYDGTILYRTAFPFPRKKK